MSLDSIILQQVIQETSKNKNTPNIVNSKNLDLQQEEKEDITQKKNKSSESIQIGNNGNVPADYKSYFRQKMIRSYIGQYIKGRSEKKYLSVTESIECPLLTWFRLTGRIREEHIQKERIFYLLNVYGIMGTAAHNFVYKMVPFELKEKSLYDNKYLMGRYDFLNHGIMVDIKTSRNPYDVTPQLGLLYYLANENKLEIKGLQVWWLLLDKITDIQLDKAKEFYERHIPEVVIPLYEAWKNDTYPKIKIDRRKLKCRECIIENFCKSYDPKKDVPIQEEKQEVSEGKKPTRTKQEETNQGVPHKKDIMFLL